MICVGLEDLVAVKRLIDLIGQRLQSLDDPRLPVNERAVDVEGQDLEIAEFQISPLSAEEVAGKACKTGTGGLVFWRTLAAAISEPHAPKQAVAQVELVIESRAGVQQHKKNEKVRNQPVCHAWRKSGQVGRQRLAASAEDDRKQAAGKGRAQTAEHHERNQQIHDPMGRDADLVQERASGLGVGRLGRSEPNSKPQEQERAHGQADRHVACEPLQLLRIGIAHGGQEHLSEEERNDDHDRHNPVQCNQ